jgi:hypothetical protein
METYRRKQFSLPIQTTDIKKFQSPMTNFQPSSQSPNGLLARLSDCLIIGNSLELGAWTFDIAP